MDGLLWVGFGSRHCWLVQGKCNREGTTSNQGIGGAMSCRYIKETVGERSQAIGDLKNPQNYPVGGKSQYLVLPHSKNTNNRFQLNQSSKKILPYIFSPSSESNPEGTKCRWLTRRQKLFSRRTRWVSGEEAGRWIETAGRPPWLVLPFHKYTMQETDYLP